MSAVHDAGMRRYVSYELQKKNESIRIAGHPQAETISKTCRTYTRTPAKT